MAVIKKWKKLNEKEVFNSGHRKIIRKTFKLPDSRNEDFDINNVGKTVAVLALTKDKKVILVKEFRPGPEKILLELPGGTCDNNEKPQTAMARELLEETGYKGKVKLIGTNYDDAYSSRLKYSFIATNCVKVKEPNLDENEFSEVVIISIDEFKTHLKTGKLTDIDISYICLNYLKLL